MKIRLLFIALLCSYCFQNINSQIVLNDTVFLKTGKSIIGKVDSYLPDNYIKIKTLDGMYFFTMNDVKKLAIHSSNFNKTLPIDISTSNQEVKPSPKTVDDIYFNTGNSDTVRVTLAKQSKYLDYIPVEMLFIQSGLEISSISSPFEVDGQVMFQATYSRRFVPELAFGFGACLRQMESYDMFAKVLFIDLRTITPQKNSFTTFSFNPGIVFYDNTIGCNLYFAYNYAKRIQKNIFFTMGVC